MKIFFSILLMFFSIVYAAEEKAVGQGNSYTKASKESTASSVTVKTSVASKMKMAITSSTSSQIAIPCPIVDKVLSSDDTFKSEGHQWTVELSSFDGRKLPGSNSQSDANGVGGKLPKQPFKIRVNNKNDDTYICSIDADSKILSCIGYVIPVSHADGKLTNKQIEHEVNYRFIFNSDHKKCNCLKNKIVCDK